VSVWLDLQLGFGIAGNVVAVGLNGKAGNVVG
jgi:hypothetical protein